MKKHLIITMLSFGIVSVAIAETGYRIVNPDGSVEFSDTYRPGAETLRLPKAQGYETPVRQAPVGAAAGKAAEQPPELIEYKSLSITSPQNDETVWFSLEGMTVQLEIDPVLAENHQVVIKLDGSEVVKGRTNAFTLGNIYRGSHSLSAAIVDDKGTELKTSSPITFHYRQHSNLR